MKTTVWSTDTRFAATVVAAVVPLGARFARMRATFYSHTNDDLLAVSVASQNDHLHNRPLHVLPGSYLGRV